MLPSWCVLAVPQKGSVLRGEAVGRGPSRRSARLLAGRVLLRRPRASFPVGLAWRGRPTSDLGESSGSEGVGKEAVDTDTGAARCPAAEQGWQSGFPWRADSAGCVMTACPCVKKDPEAASGLLGERTLILTDAVSAALAAAFSLCSRKQLGGCW